MTFSDLIIHCKYSKRLMKVLYLRIMVLLQRAQIRNTQMKTHIEWSLGRNSEFLCTFLKNLSTLTSWHDNVLSSQEAPLSPDVHMFYWGFITYVWMIKLLAIQWNLNSSSFPAFPDAMLAQISNLLNKWFAFLMTTPILKLLGSYSKSHY